MRRALVVLASLTACDMAPHYVRPTPPVPARIPVQTGMGASAEEPDLPWTALIADQRLKTVIERTLANNRDLRAALSNVEAARALYRVQRAATLPAVTGEAAASLSRRIGDRQNSYSADIGFSAFEIDLFGQVKNLTRSALESYLATEEGARAARIALIAETASAYATLAADRELLVLSRQTLASAERTLALTRSLNDAGLTGKLDVHQAETIVEQARSDIAANSTQVAQDRNALDLLAGTPIDDALLPGSLEALTGGIAKAPAGLLSDALLQRPDVLQAEHRLKAANADIGVARAAMFPRISLTAAIGVASSALSTLFIDDGFAWSATPSAAMPIFGGAARGNLDYSEAQRDLMLAQYEKAIQTAFREVSDTLAREATIDDQQAAQQRLVVANQRSYALADERYRAGIDNFLNSLTSQRDLYNAQQSAIATNLALIQNRILLYRVIGADFQL